jgi:hypothetical protein
MASRCYSAAAAILHGGIASVTNDRAFEQVKRIDILILDKLLKS